MRGRAGRSHLQKQQEEKEFHVHSQRGEELMKVLLSSRELRRMQKIVSYNNMIEQF